MSSKYRIVEAPPYMPSLFCPTMSYPTVSSYHLVESYPIESPTMTVNCGLNFDTQF